MKKTVDIIMTEDELKALKKSIKYVKRLEKNEKRKIENRSNKKVS